MNERIVFYGGMCVCVMQRRDDRQSAPVFLIFIAPMNNCRTVHCSFHGIDAFILVSRFAQPTFPMTLLFPLSLMYLLGVPRLDRRFNNNNNAQRTAQTCVHHSGLQLLAAVFQCFPMGAPNSRRMLL